MVKQFCESILRLEIERSKSLANLVMGLASQTNAKSVVETSLSSCYHFQFSSISKAIDSMCNAKRKREDIGSSEMIKNRQEVEKKFIYEIGVSQASRSRLLVTKY